MQCVPAIAQFTPSTDADLLRQYARTRDAEAFSELLRRHTHLVFSVARRITGNRHDAEDVTQACFLDMACKAASIHASLGGWLHAAATFRALNAVRDASTRRRYERNALAEREVPLQAEWKDIEPLVDAALESLPEELRRPLMLRYLNDRTQAEIADELSVDQSTVSRRLRIGLAMLRRRLACDGVFVSVSGLSAILSLHAIESVPALLKISLGKMTLAGVGGAVRGLRHSRGASGGNSATTSAMMPVVIGTAFAVIVGLLVLFLLGARLTHVWPSHQGGEELSAVSHGMLHDQPR